MTETLRLEKMIEKLRKENGDIGPVRFLYNEAQEWEVDILDKAFFDNEYASLSWDTGDTPSDAFIKAREQLEGE